MAEAPNGNTFIIRFIRALYWQNGDLPSPASKMGGNAVALCVAIANALDMEWWKEVKTSGHKKFGPTRFTIPQLMKLMGRSKKALLDDRRQGVESGFLLFTSRKDTRAPGEYNIQIPDLLGVESAPSEGTQHGVGTTPSHGVESAPSQVSARSRKRACLGVESAPPYDLNSSGAISHQNQSGKSIEKSRPAGPPGRSGFSEIDDPVLSDPLKLLAWCQKYPEAAGTTERDLLNVFSIAERALELADKPAAMFVTLVKSAQWDLISQEQEDRAHYALKSACYPEIASSPEVQAIRKRFVSQRSSGSVSPGVLADYAEYEELFNNAPASPSPTLEQQRANAKAERQSQERLRRSGQRGAGINRVHAEGRYDELFGDDAPPASGPRLMTDEEKANWRPHAEAGSSEPSKLDLMRRDAKAVSVAKRTGQPIVQRLPTAEEDANWRP